MLKKIDPSDVELGMFIHRLEGNWFRHPFWKSRFLLTEPARLELLRESGLPGVIIDTHRGRDIGGYLRRTPPGLPSNDHPPAGQPPKGQPPVRRASPAPAIPTPAASPTAPRSLAREFGQAARIADRSQRLVSRLFFEVRLGKAIKPSLVEPVINDILGSIQRNSQAFNGLMRCRQGSEHLYHHALAVSALMISLGRKLRLPADMLRAAGLVGLLQDVGIGHLPIDIASYGGDHRAIPGAILRQHVPITHELLLAGDFPEPVTTACQQHHERIDGTGYPNGLTGPSISLLGRMAAICDCYDALADDSDPAAAIARMQAMPGAFDTTLLESFIEAMGVYPIGSVVQLRSGRLAMVVDQCPSDTALPKVRAFYSLIAGVMITPVEIDLAHCYGADAIEGSVTPEAYGIADMASLREKLFLAACGTGQSRTDTAQSDAETITDAAPFRSARRQTR